MGTDVCALGGIVTWKGKEIKTIGDLVTAMESLSTKEEALKFLSEYCAEIGDNGYRNFGYCTGYMGREAGARLRGWTAVPHPVFGMEEPSDKELFRLGYEAGLKKAEEKEREEREKEKEPS